MKLKYNIGDSVKETSTGETGRVISVNISDSGVRYTITSKEVDIPNKDIIYGVKHLTEDEIENTK